MAQELWALLSYSSTGNLISASTGAGEHAVFFIEVVELINQKCSLKYSNDKKKHLSLPPEQLCNFFSSLLTAEQEGQYLGSPGNGTFFFLISPNLRFNFFQCSFSSPLQV